MKNTFLILLLTFHAFLLHGQQEILLDSCYSWARNNYPNLKKAGISREITQLHKENIMTHQLPQVRLNAQATYQSEVTGIDIPLPGISIPKPSKDQYKVYTEVRQSIWNGGLSEINLKLEDALLLNHLNQLEVEIFRINEQVSQIFFSILVSDNQIKVLQAQRLALEEKLKTIESGIKHGTTEKTPALALRAEILNLRQNEMKVESIKKASLEILSVITGKSFDTGSDFIYRKSRYVGNNNLNRPEIKLFDSQRLQLEHHIDLVSKKRNPALFGFGQAGYGRPGLNMLSDRFDFYYLIGAGISWNPFDWGETNRQKKVLYLQQQSINTQEKTFRQNLDMLLAKQTEEISNLERIIESDKELVAIRSELSEAAASRLENNIITTSEFISEVQSETIAKLNYELHKLQLTEAYENYNLITGNIYIQHP